MLSFARITSFACLLLAPLGAFSATETLVYKKVGNQELKLLVEKPADWKAIDKRPAIVFFFGGGWVGGTPEQFNRHSTYLATRGMVGLRVQYRPIPKDDLKVSCKPNALVLFNPVFDNGPGEWGNKRLGDKYKDYSPAHHITKDAPPTIVFLGDKDDLIPVKVVKSYQSRMQKAGARCDVHIYPGMGHGFFNNPPNYQKTVIEADRFLSSLGWIKGPPTLTDAP